MGWSRGLWKKFQKFSKNFRKFSSKFQKKSPGLNTVPHVHVLLGMLILYISLSWIFRKISLIFWIFAKLLESLAQMKARSGAAQLDFLEEFGSDGRRRMTKNILAWPNFWRPQILRNKYLASAKIAQHQKNLLVHKFCDHYVYRVSKIKVDQKKIFFPPKYL